MIRVCERMRLKPLSHICDLVLRPYSDRSELEIAAVAVRSERRSVWSVRQSLRSLRLRSRSLRPSICCDFFEHAQKNRC